MLNNRTYLLRNAVGAWHPGNYDAATNQLRNVGRAMATTVGGMQLGSNSTPGNAASPVRVLAAGRRGIWVPENVSVNGAISSTAGPAMSKVQTLIVQAIPNAGWRGGGATRSMLSRGVSSGGGSRLNLANNQGTPLLQYYADGVVGTPVTATATALLPNTSERLAIKAIWNNTSVEFWTATNKDSTYTKLGNTVTVDWADFSGAGADRIGIANSPAAGAVFGAFYEYAELIDNGTTWGRWFGDKMQQTGYTDASTTPSIVWSAYRPGAGLKSVVLDGTVSAVLLADGSDDYGEVADHDLLDAGTGQAFTVSKFGRAWATLGTNDTLVAKRASAGTASDAGWAIRRDASTATTSAFYVADGTNDDVHTLASYTAGQLRIVSGVRGGGKVTVYRDGVAGTSAPDDTTGDLSNAAVLRVFRLSGAGEEYNAAEMMGLAFHRHVLTTNEMLRLAAEFGMAGRGVAA